MGTVRAAKRGTKGIVQGTTTGIVRGTTRGAMRGPGLDATIQESHAVRGCSGFRSFGS